MYSPVHATAGTLIATLMPNPIAAFVVAWASHYALDALPHGDTGLGDWMRSDHAMRRIIGVEILDLGGAAAVVTTLIAQHPQHAWPTLLAGAIGGILPDLMWGLRFVLDSLGWRIPLVTTLLHQHDRWHSWVHAKHHYDVPFAVGIIYQLCILSLIFLLRL